MQRLILVGLLAAFMGLAGAPSQASAKGKKLSTATLKRLMSCTMSYTPSSWYFSTLRSVTIKNKAIGVYRADWRSLAYAFRIHMCIPRVTGVRRRRAYGLRALVQLAGVPLYASQQGSQKASRKANYYNPDMIRWVGQNIPSSDQTFFGVKAQAIYNTAFRRLVRITVYTYKHLEKVGFNRLTKQYASLHLNSAKGRRRIALWRQARSQRRRIKARFGKLVLDPILRKPGGGFNNYYFHAGHAALFWFRRGIDGTHKDVWAVLKTILKEYDPNFLPKVLRRGARKPIVLSLPKLPPPKVYTIGPGQAAQLPGILQKASPHSKIQLRPGTYRYRRALVIASKQHLTLEGIGSGPAKIVVGSRYQDVISVRNSRDITIRRISAKHADPPKGMSCAGAVVSLRRSQRIWIHKSELNGSGRYGIRGWGVRDIVITNNHLHSNSAAALEFSSSRNVLVTRNLIKNNASLLNCHYGCGIKLLNNTIQNNKGALVRSPYANQIMKRLKGPPPSR